MLRITNSLLPDGTHRVELAGTLAGPWLDEVRRILEEALVRSPRVVLEMRTVSFVSPDGATLVQEFRSRGVDLGATSPFVAELLGRQE